MPQPLTQHVLCAAEKQRSKRPGSSHLRAARRQGRTVLHRLSSQFARRDGSEMKINRVRTWGNPQLRPMPPGQAGDAAAILRPACSHACPSLASPAPRCRPSPAATPGPRLQMGFVGIGWEGSADPAAAPAGLCLSSHGCCREAQPVAHSAAPGGAVTRLRGPSAGLPLSPAAPCPCGHGGGLCPRM